MTSSGKTTVAVICGGRSAEHEISLLSARNIVAALDHEKYDLVLIGIDKSGRWFLCNEAGLLSDAANRGETATSFHTGEEVVLLCGEDSRELVSARNSRSLGKMDVAIPVLHGPFGEDGTVQGLLELAGLPYVGPDVLGSAVGMDKDVMKRLLRDAGIPNADFCAFRADDDDDIDFEAVTQRLGLPLFVKPANMGSSVGISMVRDREEFGQAVEDAFLYDRKIVIEECIHGKEIECSVLGNAAPIASVPGEVIPNEKRHGFYSYAAKYFDADGATLQIPATLPDETAKKVQELAIQTFRVLCCEGMGRVDMFVREDGTVYVNEINTIPGFTQISMYPKLWEASGIPYGELLDRLIQLAIQRHTDKAALCVSVKK